MEFWIVIGVIFVIVFTIASIRMPFAVVHMRDKVDEIHATNKAISEKLTALDDINTSILEIQKDILSCLKKMSEGQNQDTKS